MSDHDEIRDIKPSWLAMSESQLRKHLTDAKYPIPIMRDIFTKVRGIKAKMKAERTKTTVLHRMWHDVLKPARTELGSLRTMKSQIKGLSEHEQLNQGVTAKYDALCAYESLLVKVIARLVKLQAGAKADEQAQRDEGLDDSAVVLRTPKMVAEALRESKGLPMPHDGAHWTDYIDTKDRLRVWQMFDALPDPRRGKKKMPFEVRISPDEYDRRRAVLVGQIEREKERIETDMQTTKDAIRLNELDLKMQDVEKAYYLLCLTTRTTMLPTAWKKLLSM